MPRQSTKGQAALIAAGQQSTGARWGEPISKDRQIKLQQMYKIWQQKSNREEQSGPFARSLVGERFILTGADVFWLAIWALSGFGENTSPGEQIIRDAQQDAILYASLSLSELNLRKADLEKAHLEGAILNEVQLDGAWLWGARLEGATLRKASLSKASLYGVHLEKTDLTEAHLEGADLERAVLDSETILDNLFISGKKAGSVLMADTTSKASISDQSAGSVDISNIKVADVRWNGANLTTVNWMSMKELGDEQVAHGWELRVAKKRHQKQEADKTRRRQEAKEIRRQGRESKKAKRQEQHDAEVRQEEPDKDTVQTEEQEILKRYQDAIRANRQLSMVLQSQGLSEESAHFAYHAHLLQRHILLRQLAQSKLKILDLLLIILGGIPAFSLLLTLEFLTTRYEFNNTSPCNPGTLSVCVQYLQGIPTFVVLPVLMLLGFFLLALLPKIYLWWGGQQQEPQWQVLLSLLFLFAGLLLIAASPLILLPPAIISLSWGGMFVVLFPLGLLYGLEKLVDLFRWLWQRSSLVLSTCSNPWRFILRLGMIIVWFGCVFLPIMIFGFYVWGVYIFPSVELDSLENFLLVGLTFTSTYAIWRLSRWLPSLGRRNKLQINQQTPPIPWNRLVFLYGRYAFSLFLDALAGYGYRPLRSLGWYATLILGFAITYLSISGTSTTPLSWKEALVFSVTSFHGRGFFPGAAPASLDSPIIVLAAVEAIFGLLVEISFIATFTQRYFSK